MISKSILSALTLLRNLLCLSLLADAALNAKEIGKFSRNDAEAYPEYNHRMGRLVDFITPLLDQPPPPLLDFPNLSLPDKLRALADLGGVAMSVTELGEDVAFLQEVLTASTTHVLNKWFESEPLKSTLATDAVIGAMTSPSVPTSGYVLLHHCMGHSAGIPGMWSYVKGGMGGVSASLARAAVEAGVEIRTETPVRKVLLHNQEGRGVKRARGLQLEGGEELVGRMVLSCATPKVTMLDLLEEEHLSTSLLRDLRNYDYTSPVTKINLALSGLPNFTATPSSHDGRHGPQHVGTIHLVDTTEQIEDAYRDALQGIPSRRPVVEMTIPSTLDPTLAPPGHHVASLFVQYTPYAPRGRPWDASSKAVFLDSVYDVIEEYAPNFRDLVLHADVLTPPDLERVFGLTGGNIFHGAMTLNQLWAGRPHSTLCAHRTPVKGLYLCGAGSHPGGGVTGAPGRNCAKIIMQDMKTLL